MTTELYDENEGDFGANLNIEGDFNVEDEYKPIPLITKGTYMGNVTNVKFDGDLQCIIWDVVLEGNGGVLSDGETPVDGATVQYKNWLPRSGDENELTKNGRSTKRQSKINMLKRFSDDMRIDMSTPKTIVSSLQNGDWIGLSVRVVVGIREFEGRVFNDVSSMIAG